MYIYILRPPVLVLNFLTDYRLYCVSCLFLWWFQRFDLLEQFRMFDKTLLIMITNVFAWII